MTTIASNQTKSNGGTSKIDCAKECPCGVATIPVPDQWLEVMVTGGFKVWHIMFIIVALVVTLIVVYCCFHRCRIPRTKQEIEADLMRTTLTSKFRDYLQEMTNEQITFVEALKRVHEIAEKLEEDDAALAREIGNRKRMGWLKLKGKGQEKDLNPTNLIEASAEELARQQQLLQEANDPNNALKSKDSMDKPNGDGPAALRLTSNGRQATLEKMRPVKQDSVVDTDNLLAKPDDTNGTTETTKPLNRSVDKSTGDKPLHKGITKKSSKEDQFNLQSTVGGGNKTTNSTKTDETKTSASLPGVNGRPNKPVRRRRQKPPNLTRTKATAGDTTHKDPDEIHNNVLEVPVVSNTHGSNHHHTSAHTHKSKTGKAKLTKGPAHHNKQSNLT